MNLILLDYIFPFIVFFYGLLVLIVLEIPIFINAQRNMSNYFVDQLKSHKPLAWICFFVGGLWSLQNLLLYTH